MAISYPALKTELTTDPAGLGYVGKTDQQAADLINTVPTVNTDTNRRVKRDRVETWEIVEATVTAEYDALSAAEKERYARLTGLGVINPQGTNIQSAFLKMFAAGTTTRTNLSLLQWRAASRAETLYGVRVEVWDVARARAL